MYDSSASSALTHTQSRVIYSKCGNFKRYLPDYLERYASFVCNYSGYEINRHFDSLLTQEKQQLSQDRLHGMAGQQILLVVPLQTCHRP